MFSTNLLDKLFYVCPHRLKNDKVFFVCLFLFFFFSPTNCVSLENISVQFSRSVVSDPMDCSMPGLPVHHQLQEFTQTHVHWVGNAIQPSHPQLSPSLASNESVICIRWPKFWSFSFNISPFNEHSGLISFKIDWFDQLTAQGTHKFSPTP